MSNSHKSGFLKNMTCVKEDGGKEAQDPWYVPLLEFVNSENWMHLLALMDHLVEIGVLRHPIESKSSEIMHWGHIATFLLQIHTHAKSRHT